MSKKSKIRRFKKRAVALLTACMISIMSLFDCAVYRPMEAYAASIALSSSVLALLSDILLGLGVTLGLLDVVKTTAANVEEYSRATQADILANGTATTIHYSEADRPHGGAGKSFELTASDVATTIDVLEGRTVVDVGTVIPQGLLKTVSAWANQRLNVSALDLTSPVQTLTLSPEQYFNAKYVRLPIYSNDGLYMVSGAAWCYWYRRSNLTAVGFFGLPGTTITQTHIKTNTSSTRTIGDFAAASGYQTVIPATSVEGWCYYRDYSGALAGKFTSTPNLNLTSYSVPMNYLNPTIDVPFVLSPGITWNGTKDIEATLNNHKAVTDDTTKSTYINTTFPSGGGGGGGTVVDTSAYNTLNYILFTIAGYLGLSTVDVSVNDAFIAEYYADAVAGTEDEKLAQAYAIIAQAAIILQSGGQGPEDDKDKDIKISKHIADAYITSLILRHLVPADTPMMQPQTQISNIKVLEDLSVPDPDPTQPPKPTQPPEPEPDPDPDPDPGPDISLSGILEWLSKIFNGIMSIPQHIKDVGIKISNLPETISNSKLGQWVQSIPGTLTDIKNKIVELPQILPDILNAIKALPEAVLGGINTFFSLDTTLIAVSFSGMAEAFKAKFSALDQVTDIFTVTGKDFSETPPIFYMKTPECLKFAFASEQIVIMDLTPYANIFAWVRTIMAAVTWVGFGKWVIDQFDVRFHVG